MPIPPKKVSIQRPPDKDPDDDGDDDGEDEEEEPWDEDDDYFEEEEEEEEEESLEMMTLLSHMKERWKKQKQGSQNCSCESKGGS